MILITELKNLIIINKIAEMLIEIITVISQI